MTGLPETDYCLTGPDLALLARGVLEYWGEGTLVVAMAPLVLGFTVPRAKLVPTASKKFGALFSPQVLMYPVCLLTLGIFL